MKVRDAIRLLKARGCEPVGGRGSHQKWRLPNGHTIPIVANKKNDDVTDAVLMTLRQEFRRAGMRFDR